MHDKLMQKLEKKGKKLNPIEQKAKLSVLKDLSSQAGDALGSKLSGLKKVTVASGSKDGLEAGLEKAKELIGPSGNDPEELVEEAEEEMGEDLDHDNEEGESLEHKMAVLGDDLEDCSPEELEAKIQMLQEMKQKKLAQV